MSSPTRLILLSGTGGAGASTIAAATVQALAEEGLTAVLVDVEDAGDPSARATTLFASAARALAGWTGADPVEPETWSDLPTVRHLDAWLTIDAALQGDVDAVVVDCGDLRQARDLVAFPMIALRILDRVLNPVVAMRREASDASPGTAERATRGFDRLSDLHAAVTLAVEVVTGDGTSMRLVCSPTDESVSRIMHAAAVMPLLGVDVDGIVMNRFARKGAAAADVEEQAQLLERLTGAADGPLAWKSGSKVRAVPKGRSAMGPLGSSRVLRSESLHIQAHDDGYSLTIPLVGDARAVARVGRLGDDLVVAFDGVHRWIALPSVLRRCRALSADRAPAGLVVSFAPDASLWRSPVEDAQGAA